MSTDDAPADLFRRQFIVTDERPPTVAADWTRLSLGGGIQVAAHPDLLFGHQRRGDCETLLLGFATDPRHPARNSREILLEVTDALEQGMDPADATAALGGRWVLVVRRPGELCALADAGGLRQLFYTDDTHDEFVCASQPGLIGQHLGLSTSPEAMDGFVESEVRPGREFWWPGDSSPLTGVRRLLPNHLLDLHRRSARRFWPTHHLTRVPLKRAVVEGAELLKGQVASAAGQFELAQSITAGIDSRTVLAASRSVAADVYYYTLRFDDVDPNDIEVPAELLAQLGLQHHVIDTPDTMSPGFSELYHRNVLWAHDRWGAMVEGMVGSYPTQRVAMDGTVSEVARCGYYGNGEHPTTVTAESLAEMAEMAPTAFTLDQFERWLQSARPAANLGGIALLDLFYWEQRVGNWASAALVELDLVQETFTPFNHRELLATLLAVDHRLRASPRARLYQSLISHMWPETLAMPTNPVPTALRLKYKAISGLQALRLTGPLRRLLRRLPPRSRST